LSFFVALSLSLSSFPHPPLTKKKEHLCIVRVPRVQVEEVQLGLQGAEEEDDGDWKDEVSQARAQEVQERVQGGHYPEEEGNELRQCI